MPSLFQRLFDSFAPPAPHVTALVLSGGGARSSYQAGALRFIAEAYPDAHFDVLSGTSAGAINVAHLANTEKLLGEAVAQLCDVWGQLTTGDVYEAVPARELARTLLQLVAGRDPSNPARSLARTEPLARLLRTRYGVPDGRLTGVARNIEKGRLRALAIATTNYGTGQNVTWVQGRAIEKWQRPDRVGVGCELTVAHVLASTALPFFFPAVALGDGWHGDGGIRQAAPLSPAIHLGATRLLTITTRYNRSRREADVPMVTGYPPPGQVLGILMNAIFLDVLDQDLDRFERLNSLLRSLPPGRRAGMKPIRLLALKPSEDIGALAGEYHLHLDGAMRFVLRGIAEGETPDWLSMILFDGAYTQRLMELGYRDAQAARAELDAFFAP